MVRELVDNALDAIQVFVKPIAGVILMTCVLTELSPLQAAVLGLIAGATMALTSVIIFFVVLAGSVARRSLAQRRALAPA